MPEINDEHELYLLGVSFRTAPLAVREGLSFSRDEAVHLLSQAARAFPWRELAIVSTCNRTEFYLSDHRNHEVVQSWIDTLRRLRPQAPILHPDCTRYEARGEETVRHLMRVVCGLDSAVLGDGQILGQIKQAIAIAEQAGSLGTYLGEAFAQAVRTGKRARRETTIGWGSASLGSVLAAGLRERLPKRRPASILVIGAGEIAREIARHLAKAELGEMTFVNRTETRAAKLVEHYGGRTRPWAELDEVMAASDVVVAATAARRPILSKARLDAVVSQRGDRPPLIIDAGVPRNVETGSAAPIIDIDSLQERQSEALARRRANVPVVEGIIDEEMLEWERWRGSRPIEHLIKSLYQEAEALSRREAMEMTTASAVPYKQAKHFLLRSYKRLLYGHTRRLRGRDMVACLNEARQ